MHWSRGLRDRGSKGKGKGIWGANKHGEGCARKEKRSSFPTFLPSRTPSSSIRKVIQASVHVHLMLLSKVH